MDNKVRFSWKTWAKRFCVLFAIILLPGIWGRSEARGSCALCDYPPYHAPCLVSLSTGQLGELVVYDSHFSKAGEIAAYQQGGTFSFLSAAGLTGYRDTENWTTVIRVPGDAGAITRSHFCKACQKLLTNHSDDGFVLADMHTAGLPVLYAIEDGAKYDIRCYRVQVSGQQDYTITVTGELFA